MAWAHLGLTAQRNIPFFMIAMAAPVTIWLEEIVATFQAAPGPPRFAAEVSGEDSGPRFPLLSIAAMVLVFMLLRAPGSPPKFQPRYDSERYPEAALAAVRRMNPSTRLLTTDLWGGYLIYRLYPDVRVFWDGRVDFYGTRYNQAAVDTFMGGTKWKQTLAEHRITAALVPANLALASLLAESKDWQPVYRDKTAVLFQLSPPLAP